MRVEPLRDTEIERFLRHCKEWRCAVDDSFLNDEDLKSFRNDKENPTYLLKDGEEVIGAASLMMGDYFRRGKRGRFRIFYSEIERIEAYRLLLEAILPHTNMIDRFFLFVHGECRFQRDVFKTLGFEIERYSFVLDRTDSPVGEVRFPEGYQLRTFQFERDEEAWCEVRNDAFASLAGSETPVLPQEVKKMRNEEGYIEGSIKVLFDEHTPVGLVRTTREVHKGEVHLFIHLIAVKKSYHRKGLGRNLLRAGLQFGKGVGLTKALITVNAENEKAVNLYLSEGFEQYETMVCYNYNLNS
ncbi:GNAT family N-acetyltransferase [Pseudalkalibacillus sp. R45]|uniref:GNAT family N-acetyltransferase n=1 Tax=Pseudalkalibacillus sp. R45 TaxID=3457433 RepID=UPI003FCDE9DE